MQSTRCTGLSASSSDPLEARSAEISSKSVRGRESAESNVSESTLPRESDVRACVSIERRSELSRLRARAVGRGEEADGETSRPRALSPALADMRSRNYQTNEIAKKKIQQTNDAEKGPKEGLGSDRWFSPRSPPCQAERRQCDVISRGPH